MKQESIIQLQDTLEANSPDLPDPVVSTELLIDILDIEELLYAALHCKYGDNLQYVDLISDCPIKGKIHIIGDNILNAEPNYSQRLSV